MLKAYVTLPKGGEEMFTIAPDDFGVDRAGSLFLVFKKNESGAIIAGKIYAQGHWSTIEVETKDM